VPKITKAAASAGASVITADTFFGHFEAKFLKVLYIFTPILMIHCAKLNVIFGI